MVLRGWELMSSTFLLENEQNATPNAFAENIHIAFSYPRLSAVSNRYEQLFNGNGVILPKIGSGESEFFGKSWNYLDASGQLSFVTLGILVHHLRGD